MSITDIHHHRRAPQPTFPHPP